MYVNLALHFVFLLISIAKTLSKAKKIYQYIANNFFGLNVSESNSNHLDMKANHFLIIK